MKTPKKILICGLGSVGRRHLRLLREDWPSIKIGVLRSGLGQACDEEIFADERFQLPDDSLQWCPDAVIISSPASIHLQHALFFASEGIPLLIEKPLGTGLEDIDQFLKLAAFAKTLPILIGYVLRYDSCLLWLKQRLDEGALGQVVEADFHCASWLPEWRPGTDYRSSVSSRSELGGGVLLELSHEIDLANWLLPKPLQLSSALFQQSGLLDLDVEDTVILTATTIGNASVTLRLNFCTQPVRRSVIIRGNQGELSCDIVQSKAQLRGSDGSFNQFLNHTIPDMCYKQQLQHFMACIERREAPICNVADGLDVLKLVQEARMLSQEANAT